MCWKEDEEAVKKEREQEQRVLICECCGNYESSSQRDRDTDAVTTYE
jgi:hypothetical protein